MLKCSVTGRCSVIVDSTLKKENAKKKSTCFRPGSNWGPSVC